MKYPERISETVKFLQDHGVGQVDGTVILGTGLGSHFVEAIKDPLIIPYEEIPHFPEATVEFHHGKLVYGSVGERKVLAFNGRFHFYEGYSMNEVTYPVRVAKGLNAGYLLISNAAGCMNLAWEKGDLMLIEDHINLQNTSPLVGENFEELGPRFTDMSAPYSTLLSNTLREKAKELKITLREGVYAGVTGPQLETRAEYRHLRMIGADVVGMSTVPEVIVANHASLPCAAVSVLTDMCDPDNLHPIDIKDIIKTAGEAEILLTRLFLEVIS